MKSMILPWFSISANAQSNFKSFFDFSRPKKAWVLLHSFKAVRSLEAFKEANRVIDSITKNNLLGGDATGGQIDAFRHGYWMAQLYQEIGKRTTRSLGKAHKKRKFENRVVPDKISSEMDLYNNNVGLKLISKGSKVSKKRLIYRP
jgi:hypothetical protein